MILRSKVSTDEMMACAGILPLMDQVHANRLRFLARLLNACPPITWALMHHTTGHHSWMAQCMDSCQWLLYHYDSKLPLSTSSLFQDWVQFVRLDPNWKGRVRKHASSPCRTIGPELTMPFGNGTLTAG